MLLLFSQSALSKKVIFTLIAVCAVAVFAQDKKPNLNDAEKKAAAAAAKAEAEAAATEEAPAEETAE